jgi:DNA modification methylase
MKIETIALNQIKPYEKNAKTHPKKQIDLLAENIKRFGFTTPCLVDKDNNLIAGHGRLEAVKTLGWTDVPCVRMENLTEDEVKALRLADNKLAEMSEWDMALVTDELKELDDDLLDLTGFDKDLIVEPDEADDEVPDVPEEPQSKLGDLYELGGHRVLCGDSTKIEDVERLMDGKKADMVFTDPPYGMRLDTDYSKMGGSKTKYDKIIGDDADFDISFIFSILPSPIYYIWGAEYLYDTIPNFKQGSLVVWAKRQSEAENKVFGSAYELCWVFPKIKKEIWFIRGINQSSERLGAHPTQKPTELGVRAIKDRTEEGNLIGDLFLGSGSTLIASEKTGRICYGMELDPKYADVIVQRYVDYTGNATIKKNGEEIIWKKTETKPTSD